MGAPVSRAPPFYPRVSTAPSFCGVRRRSRGARTSRASRRLGGRGHRTGAAAPGTSLRWHFCSRKVGTSEIWWWKGSREQLGGSAACWGLPAARHRCARCWGKLPRSLLASPAVRAQPRLGTPASASQGKGSESMHQAWLFALFPPAPGGKSSTFGSLRVSWLPAAKEDPRPLRPSWPLQRSAPAGSCF